MFNYEFARHAQMGEGRGPVKEAGQVLLFTALMGIGGLVSAGEACGDMDAWEAFSGEPSVSIGEDCASPVVPLAPPRPRAPSPPAVTRPAPAPPALQLASAAPLPPVHVPAPVSVAAQGNKGRAVVQQPSSGVSPKAPAPASVTPTAPITALPTSPSAPIAAAPKAPMQAVTPPVSPKAAASIAPTAPKEVWSATVGQTLWKTVSVWTAKNKWTLDWQSADLDYPIDYPLTFEGTYQDAVEQLFELYADAPRSFTYEGSTALKTLKVCEFKASTYQGKPKCK